MAKFTDRLRHAWNAFVNNRDPTSGYYGEVSYRPPSRFRVTRGSERSITTAIYNRIAIDAAAISIRHVQLDEEGRFSSVINDGLNQCLTVEANIDQSGRAFIQDAVFSMLEEGHVALVPAETSADPKLTTSYDIRSLRVGKVTRWYPRYVTVDLYNDRTGRHQEVTLPKSMVAIVENPLYAIMNEPNSTLQRLIRKLNYLDAIDEQSSSGKLDLIIQLPYVIKTPQREEQAEKRRKQIEMQLAGSKYGIAYTDGTEKITQLNRSLDNNLMKQIEYLTSMLYGQLGITDEIINGTANEQTMLNYNNRTVEPILAALTDAMIRTFLTKTARTQGQSILYFREPFRLVPVQNLADIADKFTRNEILSPNEVRTLIGFKPSAQEGADELRNRNISQSDAELEAKGMIPNYDDYGYENQNGSA